MDRCGGCRLLMSWLGWLDEVRTGDGLIGICMVVKCLAKGWYMLGYNCTFYL